MQDRLNIRRDRYRESIRKEYNKNLLRKKRIEILEVADNRDNPSDPYKQLCSLLLQEASMPFNYKFMAQLMEFTAREDSERSYIMVGNYIIDHQDEQCLGMAFQYYRNRTSCKGYFPWVVRLLLIWKEADCQVYAKRIDQFLVSENVKAVKYGLSCVQLLIEKEEYRLVLNLSSLDEVVSRLPYHQVAAIRRCTKEVVLELLTNSESARQKLLGRKDVVGMLIQVLRNDEFNQQEKCLKAILAVYEKSLTSMSSNQLFGELVMQHQAHPKLQPIISQIFLACAKSLDIESLCALLNAGLKNTLCSHLDLETLDNDLIFRTLKVIEAIFRRLSSAEEYDVLYLLKQHLEQAFQLSHKLTDMLMSPNPTIQSLAEGILQENYDYDEEEDLLHV